MPYALILADPNSNEVGEIVSRHCTAEAVERAAGKLGYARWAYVAKHRDDGTFPARCEVL